MPRNKLTDSEKKRRRQERQKLQKRKKRASEKPATQPSQDELDARQETRRQQWRDGQNRTRKRRRIEASQESEQLIVEDVRESVPDTNAILQQMSQENHVDRMQIVGAQESETRAIAPHAQMRIVDSQDSETHTIPPPARMPLPTPITAFATPLNPLVFMPRLPDVPTYGARANMRRELGRQRVEQRVEQMRENNRLAQERFQERRRSGAEQQEQQQEPPPSVHEILTSIGKGEARANGFVPLHEHPDIDKAHTEFHRDLHEYKTTSFFHCPYCKERGPHTRKAKNFEECTVCLETRKKETGCRKFSKENRMDPFPEGYGAASHLPKLWPVEEAMIARSHTVMKCYRIQGTGRVMYKGNVVNLHKETNLLNAVPAALEELPICFIVRIDHPNAPTHRDFKCRREVVKLWLQFLQANHPMYRHLQIRWDRVDALPEDGNVSDRIQRVLIRGPPATVAGTAGAPQQEEEEQELEDGPDTSGATGAVGDNDDDDDQLFIPRPLQEMNNGLEADRIRQFVLNEDLPPATSANPIVLPPGGQPLNDYDTPNLQSMAFPTLFPYGEGDVTNADRTETVTMCEANKHLLWYCVRNQDGEFEYPFAQHTKWMYWAQNTDERHRLNQLKQVYQRRSPEFTGMEVNELRAMAIQRNEDELRRMTSSMQAFSGQVLGSDSYFYKKRKELEALMQAEGSPTLWFTFSAADNHWLDLHALGPTLGEDLTEKQKVRKRAKWVRQNPHVVDAYFFDRIKFMVQEFFGNKGLKTSWVWFRIEFQSRGTAHVHGCCRLKSDPGLMDLAQQVLQGREARLQLMASRKYHAWEDPFSVEDVSRDNIERTFENHPLSPNQVEELKSQMQKGFNAQEIIREYNDYLICTWHPAPPSDALSDERDPATIFVQGDNNRHPCNAAPEERGDNLYCQTISTVQRHQCGPYCLKDGKCSKNFPIPVHSKTLVSVVQTKGRRGGIRTKMELYTKRNDKFLNAHCRAFLMAFKANMDIRLTIDIGKVVQYMCKYVTKTESMNTRRTRSFYASAMNQATNNGEETNTRVVLNRYMTTLAGSRPRGKEETCHLIDSNPLVYSSHVCKKVNLHNNSVAIEVEDGEIRGKVTVVDAYARRMEGQFWSNEELYRAARNSGVADMNLNDFCHHFTVGLRGQGKNKIIRLRAKNYVQFTPSYSCHPNGSKYIDYCRLALVRFKEWKTDYHAVYGGQNATDQEVKANWENFLLEWSNGDRPAPDFLQQEMIRVANNLSQSQNSLDDGNQGGNAGGGLLGGGGNGDDDDDDDDGADFELEYSTLGIEYDHFDQEVANNLEWDEAADWTQAHHDYDRCLFEADPVAELQRLVTHTTARRVVDSAPISRDSLNQRQRKFVELVEKLLSYEDEDSPIKSSTDGGSGLSRCVLLRGRGGTGKSYGMEYLQQNLGPGEVLPLATTGKAATVIKGSTCFNKRSGLALPVARNVKWTELKGRPLNELQAKHKNVRVVFIDEYSMLDQKYLQIINMRLQEIKQNRRPFGGVVMVLVGDTAQLPPVNGLPLYSRNRKGCLPSQLLYFSHFTSVIELIESKRVNPNDPESVWFKGFLNRLADAEVTPEDVNKLRRLCSKHSMDDGRWSALGFDNPDITHLFSKNADVDAHNEKALTSLENPIVKITAKNTSSWMKKVPADRCGQLHNVLFLARDSKVTLTNNLCPELGLANGSTGKVKDILYRPGESSRENPQTKKADLPYCVWVEMEDYCGPSFFPEEDGRDKWIPIYPRTHMELNKKGEDWVEEERTMIPLRLAWA